MPTPMEPSVHIRRLEGVVDESNTRILKLEMAVRDLQAEVNRLLSSGTPHASGVTLGGGGGGTPAPLAVPWAAVAPAELPPSEHVKLKGEDLDEGEDAGEKLEGIAVELGADDKVEDDWDSYEFQESTWDLCMFIGLPPLGRLGSLMVTFLVILTVAMQLVFCALINDNLTSPLISPDVLKSIQDWRAFYGHDIRYMDDISQQSMTRLVCDKRDVIFSTGQKDLLATIEEYISEGVDSEAVVLGPLMPPIAIPVGPLMCVIALLVWYMTLLRDFDSLRSLARAMELVPRGRRTRITKPMDGSGTYVVECLSAGRKSIIFAVMLLRLFVHVALIWSGSLYLAYTISLADLILNAVALETVLTLDGLVFAAFAPYDSKRFISSLAPLPKPKRCGYGGVDWISAAGLALAFSLTFAMLFATIIPQANTMKDAKEVMCGGNVDFVSAIGNDGLVSVYPSKQQGEDGEWRQTYAYRALREAILYDDQLDPQKNEMLLSRYAFGISGSQRSVDGDLSVSRSTSILNPFCTDLIPNGTNMQVSLFRQVFGFADAGGGGAEGAAEGLLCSHPEVLRHCHRDAPEGVRARQYCPEACGCRDVSSSLILTSPEEGCPAACSLLPPAKAKNCSDEEVTSEAWQAYGQGLRELNSSWTGEWQTSLTNAYRFLIEERHGCGIVIQMRNEVGLYLCDPGNQFHWKPLTNLCPETCRCASSPRSGCPDVCSA